MDLSSRAQLVGVREVRGLVLDVRPEAEFSLSPTLVVPSEWATMTRGTVDNADPTYWQFRGEASVVEHPYTVRDAFGDFQETMSSGAFDKTLRELPPVSFNFMHDMSKTMATTGGGSLKLAASPNLAVEARVARSSLLGQMYMPLVESGDATSMSFAFRVIRQTWNEDYTQRTINEVSLNRGDVAVIVSGFGANPAAWGTVRSDIEPNQADPVELRVDTVDLADEVPQSIREDLAHLYSLRTF